MVLLNINDSQNDKSKKFLSGTAKIHVFRLIAVFYLVFLLNPGQFFKQKELPAAEYGIGGGYYTGIEQTGVSLDFISDIDDEILFNSLPTYGIDSGLMDLDSLSKPRFLFYDSYIVRSGDNISTLAIVFGLNQDTIISVNKITNSRLLQIGRVLRIPNQDGILHTVNSGDTLDSLADQYRVNSDSIKIINELFSENITVGMDIFIPGARLDWNMLQEINGDLFVWPVIGAITSPYGYRRNPFNPGVVQFHNGIDIRASSGTPVRAAMAGRIGAVGWDNYLGNYIIINHHSGYRTLYAHLSAIRTRTGANVFQGERIGDVGSTGQSTGPHLHFTVYRNGVTVNPRILMR